MAENPFAGLRSLLSDIQPPAGPRPSNPGTMYEGRSFGSGTQGPLPTAVTNRPDLNAPAAPPAAPPEQMGQAMRGFRTGVEGMKEINWSVVAALGQVFGAETVQKWGLENAEAANRRAQDFLPRIARIEDIAGPRDFVDWTLGTLGQLAPFALESAATAIAGAVIGGAMAGPAGAGAGALAGVGRGAAVKEAIKAAAKGTATAQQQQVARQAMARLGSQVGVVASSYKTGFGDVYNETVEGGDPSPGLAAVVAAPYAALDSLPELVLVNRIAKLFGREGAQEVARGLVQRVGIAAVKQALLEGGTEGSQEALLILARKAVQSGYDPTGEETRSRLLNATAAGAVGGASVGGVVAAFDRGAPAQPGAATPAGTPPGTPGGDVSIDTIEAQPQAPAAGIPMPGAATVSPLMPSGEAQLQTAPVEPAAPQPPVAAIEPGNPPAPPVAPAIEQTPVEPALEQPPVTAGIPAFGGAAPTATAAPLMPGGQPEQSALPPLPGQPPVADPVTDAVAAPVEPVAAGIPRTPSEDAASLLGDPAFAAAAADLGVLLGPEAAPPVAPVAPVAAPKPEKKAKQTKAQRKKAYKDANQFKAFLSEYGVRADLKLDIMGDKKAPNPPVPYGKGPVFRKNGMNLDELASYAMQLGFITEQQMEDPTDTGATRLLADMIRRQMNGEGNLQTIAGIEDELDQRMGDAGVEAVMTEAARRGIPTDGRPVAEVDEDVKRAQARDLGVDPDGLSVDEVAEEIEQAEVNRLLEEAAEGGGEVLLDALAVDPDGRIALAMLDDDGAVERASRDAEDDVDFLNRIEDIIRGSGRTDANAAADTGDRESRSRGGRGTANAARAGPGGATEGDNPDGAGGDRASGAQESDVSSSGRESGEARADADRQPDGARRQDSDGVDQNERAGAESDRARGRPEDGSDQGRDGASTADAEGGSIGSRIRAEIGRLASPKSDAESAGFELQGETSEELTAKAAREARVKAELDAADRKARKQEKAADDAKSDKRQADATVDDFKLGQDAQTQMVGPDLLDPLANNYAALQGKTIVQTVPMEGGKSATLKMDAAKALRGFDERLAALKSLGDCIARPR